MRGWQQEPWRHTRDESPAQPLDGLIPGAGKGAVVDEYKAVNDGDDLTDLLKSMPEGMVMHFTSKEYVRAIAGLLAAVDEAIRVLDALVQKDVSFKGVMTERGSKVKSARDALIEARKRVSE